jgi:hypothetical protein
MMVEDGVAQGGVGGKLPGAVLLGFGEVAEDDTGTFSVGIETGGAVWVHEGSTEGSGAEDGELTGDHAIVPGCRGSGWVEEEIGAGG